MLNRLFEYRNDLVRYVEGRRIKRDRTYLFLFAFLMLAVVVMLLLFGMMILHIK